MTAALLIAWQVGVCWSGSSIEDACRKVVKLYGAGAGRIEAYGTGVLVSADGKILTAFSAMLQGESIVAVLADGRRRPAKALAFQPKLGVALLQIESSRLHYFDLQTPSNPKVGDVVYALSNQFGVAAGDESVSVQRGMVAAKTSLTGRLGVRDGIEIGDALVLDCASNNPGSAGGAVVDGAGRLVGIIGRELRHPASGAWIHYAQSIASLRGFVADPLRIDAKTADEPASVITAAAKKAAMRGMILLPDWLDRTPPYIDGVEPKSAAAAAGLLPDDQIVMVEGQVMGAAADVQLAMLKKTRKQQIGVVVRRAGRLMEIQIAAEDKTP